MIDREPHLYKNRNDHQCKYPKPIPETYDTGELTEDKVIASRINELIGQLKGIHYLQSLRIPAFIYKLEDKKKYVLQRLKSAPALAAFMIKSTLRSSHCACYEYLLGSDEASKFYDLKSVKKRTGNIIRTIENCRANSIPEEIVQSLIPESYDWLVDAAKYDEACVFEINTYRQILEKVKALSGSRELTKVTHLINKAKQYGKILAFDSTIITLDYFEKLIQDRDKEVEVIVATGQRAGNRDLIKDMYSLDAPANRNVIALCSDAMSEGINLPNAKALVLLDMPSVLRKIEQRIGRLERMDSEHKEIYVSWPNDSDEFSLRGDKRVLDILIVTENLIGNNVDIPKKLYDKYLANDPSLDNLIKAYEEYSLEDYEWEGVKDNTESLYNLISGPGALIDDKTYESLKEVDATVKSKISFVKSDYKWSFFAFRGDATKSAKWLLVDKRGKGLTDFSEIANTLREYLASQTVVQKKWKQVDTKKVINEIISLLRSKEMGLLSWKKRRALDVSRKLLTHYYEKTQVKSRKLIAQKLLQIFNPDALDDGILDYEHFADLWLAVLLPALDKKRESSRRRRSLITLKDLTLKDVRFDASQLASIYENCRYANTLDELIAACIIAV